MKRISRSNKVMFATATLIAAAFCAIAFTQPAKARPPIPGPLCGPTLQWSCSGPGGPDVLFIGTKCDKFQFERKTGLTCVPLRNSRN